MKFVLLFLFCCMALFSGCSHNVNFAPNAPYSASNKIAAPLVIVVPDNTDLVSYKTVQNKLYYYNKYHIYYGQALRNQAIARLDRKVDRLFVVTDSEYAYLQGTEPEGLEFISNQKAKKFPPITEEELKARMEFVPAILKEDIGYLLIIRKVQFQFEGGVGQYIMEVEFRNRSTNEELFQGIFRGNGKPMNGNQSVYTYKIQINEAVSSSFAQGFSTIEKEIDKAIAKEKAKS